VTLHAIEARLHRKPELDKLDPKVVEALARAVMRFVQDVASARAASNKPDLRAVRASLEVEPHFAPKEARRAIDYRLERSRIPDNWCAAKFADCDIFAIVGIESANCERTLPTGFVRDLAGRILHIDR
jgi:hypothetical protein